MKHIDVLILIILALILAGFAQAGSTDSLNRSSELNVTLLDYGPIGDHGWTYEAHVGAVNMAKKLPYVKLTEVENAAGPNAAQIMREHAKNGSKLIFCHSLTFEDAIKEVAPEYPDTIFMWCGGTDKLAPNVGTYYGRIYQVEYLAGIVAGMMTRTNKIAFVSPPPDPEVVKAIDAFAQGASSVNPRAKVYVEWVGSYYDPVKEKQLALSLIVNGCDVITHGTDSDATGEAAEETGTYFISFSSDTSRFTPQVFLTGILWNWEPIMTDIAQSVQNGTWQSRPNDSWWYGLPEGGVKLAPFSNLVPNSVRTVVDSKQKAIMQKKLVIFPGLNDTALQRLYYLEPNVVGSLPEQ